jgi:hypothetical protein
MNKLAYELGRALAEQTIKEALRPSTLGQLGGLASGVAGVGTTAALQGNENLSPLEPMGIGAGVAGLGTLGSLKAQDMLRNNMDSNASMHRKAQRVRGYFDNDATAKLKAPSNVPTPMNKGVDLIKAIPSPIKAKLRIR